MSQSSQSTTLRRAKVDIDNYGSPVGKNGSKVASKIGKLVRNHVPISYPSWKKVLANYKEDVWNQLEKYYELDPLSKDLMLRKMSDAFRRHKRDLRTNYYDIFNTDEERMRNCPPKIAKDDWEEFIRYESTPEAKEKRKQGKKNSSILEYSHHSGRKSHAMITQEMVDSSPGTEVSRLQDKIKKEKETTSGGDEDVFITVFGKDVKGRSRSIEPNISPTQVKSVVIPCKRLKEVKGEYEQRLQVVEQKLLKVYNMDDKLERLLRLAEENRQVDSRIGTSRKRLKEVKGEYEQRLQVVEQKLLKVDNMDDKLERLLRLAEENRQVGSGIGTSQFATSTNQLIDQRCEILNFEDEVIATGTICRDSTALVIHGKPVPSTYEKVLLDEILLPNELTTKMNRHITKTFGEVGVGGYVSHQKGLLRYL